MLPAAPAAAVGLLSAAAAGTSAAAADDDDDARAAAASAGAEAAVVGENSIAVSASKSSEGKFNGFSAARAHEAIPNLYSTVRYRFKGTGMRGRAHASVSRFGPGGLYSLLVSKCVPQTTH
jgi:hypothetical protein